jgi:polysaccharide pyruvyl transferase WcaK-like protein
MTASVTRSAMAGSVRPLSLIHLVNARSANVGNGALSDGAELVLAEDLGRPTEFRREAWDDYTFGVKPFDACFVDLINASDAMIVGGAVALNGQPYYPNAGMRFDLPQDLWSKIKRPVVFYGLSHRHWASRPYHHADKLRWALNYILDRDDMLLAVRNDGTREWLHETLGFADDRMHIVPDPGVFVPAERDGTYHEFVDGKLNVILAFNDEDREQRFGTPETRTRIIEGIARATERMLGEWDANVVIVPHYFDDFRMTAEFIDTCRPQLAHQHKTAAGLAGLAGSRHFYGRYLKADIAISMRVHSMSPCIGLGVPMVPLVTQARMTDFLADCGLADLAVDAFAPDLAERLFGAIRRTVAERQEIRRRFLDARAALRERARLFNGRVARLLAA